MNDDLGISPPWEKADTDNRTLRARAPSLVGDGTVSPVSQTQADGVQQALVCVDCAVYFEHKGGWGHCPQCAGELLEVERA